MAVHIGQGWIERVFGHEVVREFARPQIAVGDDYEDDQGICWHVDAKGRCPYVVPPARFADYGTKGTWVYLWRVTERRDVEASIWMPERYLADLIERGEGGMMHIKREGVGMIYNFRTQSWEEAKPVTEMTDDEARQYISQVPAAQGMFGCYRELGYSVAESMLRVLHAQVGEKYPE
jgi:hypothetical protein